MRLVQGKLLDSFARIRDVIYKQQQALVEQRNYDQQNYKPPASEADDDDTGYHLDKLEGSGGFAGSDAKKRRGRAAPPGRCHSCNRAETPEWRRGPDGARTLCNACGLRKFFFTIICSTVTDDRSRLREIDQEDGDESS